MGKTERKAAYDALEAGKPYLFLTTDTYLRHYNKKNNLPAALKCMAYIWPEGQDLIDKEWNEKYNIAVLPALKKIRVINRPKNWKPEGKRILVYANRKRSLPKMNSGIPFFIEAGVKELENRKAARLAFAACQSGALWWDGSTSFLPSAGNINEFVLLDVPYGRYELTAAYSEIGGSLEIPALIAFKPEDMAFNRSYLNRLCPQPDTIIAVWKYLNTFPDNCVRQDINILLKELGVFLQKNLNWSEVLPIIQILGDLDLCRMKKQGSIIEIKFIKAEIVPSDINNSLFYLEGLAEKAAYYKLEEELIKNLPGDIYGT
jgi:single-stranded-DNA-specific exonuclease